MKSEKNKVHENLRDGFSREVISSIYCKVTRVSSLGDPHNWWCTVLEFEYYFFLVQNKEGGFNRFYDNFKICANKRKKPNDETIFSVSRKKERFSFLIEKQIWLRWKEARRSKVWSSEKSWEQDLILNLISEFLMERVCLLEVSSQLGYLDEKDSKLDN